MKQARDNIRQYLKDKELYVSQDPNPMPLSLCSRSGDVLEPMLKPQVLVCVSVMNCEPVM